MHADISINGMIFQSSNLALITRIYNVYNFTFYRRIWYEGVWTPLISHDSKSTGKETKASPSCWKSLSDQFSLSRSYIQAYDTKLPCSFRCCVWRRSTALVSMVSPVYNTMYFSAVRITRSWSKLLNRVLCNQVAPLTVLKDNHVHRYVQHQDQNHSLTACHWNWFFLQLLHQIRLPNSNRIASHVPKIVWHTCILGCMLWFNCYRPNLCDQL